MLPRPSHRASLALLLASATGCLPAGWFSPDAGAGHPDAGPTLSCEGPRKASGQSPWLIYNGTRTPTLLPLSEAQQNAVVAVDSLGICSGSLIAPRVVLTAKHCLVGLAADDVRVLFGPDDTRPLAHADVVQLRRHSGSDLALLELGQDATTLLDVVPIPIHVDTIDSSWVGERVEAAGYGITRPGGDSDGRYFVAEPVYAVGVDTLKVTGEGERGLCGGDSGGPVMAVVPGGAVRVLGALYGGDTSCSGVDTYTRTDPYYRWIEETTGPTPPVGPTPCGTVLATGRCEAEGQRALYCADDNLRRDDCAAAGLVCGYDTSARGFRCIAPGSDPCQGVDALGRCEDRVSVWCAGGELLRFDCAPCAMACGWASDAIGYDCVADPCAGLDYLGRCDGDRAEWCNGGVPDAVDCSDYGQTCGWVSDSIGYYCIDP